MYCAFVKDCEKVAAYLKDQGISATVYNGQMEEGEKSEAFRSWMTGEVQVVVGTNAFGMGVDKPDVRWVLHYHLPSSMEACLQEMGRAGRDGLASNCTILYSAKDVNDIMNKLKNNEDIGNKRGQALDDVKHFCLNNRRECRHFILLKHFEDEAKRPVQVSLAPSVTPVSPRVPCKCPRLHERGVGRPNSHE